MCRSTVHQFIKIYTQCFKCSYNQLYILIYKSTTVVIDLYQDEKKHTQISLKHQQTTFHLLVSLNKIYNILHIIWLFFLHDISVFLFFSTIFGVYCDCGCNFLVKRLSALKRLCRCLGFHRVSAFKMVDEATVETVEWQSPRSLSNGRILTHPL